MAEGGCGGNSAVFLQKIEASPAALLVKAMHHRKILFSLGEKEIRRAPCLPAGRQNEKSKEYFSVVRRVVASGGGLAALVWFRSRISDKMSSSQTVKTHPLSLKLQRASPMKLALRSPWRSSATLARAGRLACHRLSPCSSMVEQRFCKP